MNEKPIKSKYKALHGAVRSFTEGVSGILSSGFQELASHAVRTSTAHYDLDFIRKTAVPDIPVSQWREWLFDFRDLPAWFDDVGCSLVHVPSLTMSVDFELGSVVLFRGKNSSEKRVTASVETLLADDRGTVHRFTDRVYVFFDSKRNDIKPNQASHATSEPAPGAASSSREG